MTSSELFLTKTSNSIKQSCVAKKSKTNNWLINFGIVFFVFFTDTVLFGTNSNALFTTFQRLFVIFFAAFLLFKTINIKAKGKIKLRDNYAYVCIGFTFLTILMIGRLANGFYYYTVIACIIIGVCFSKICTLEVFAKKYISIMSFIALFSLVVYFFNKQLYTSSFLPTITNTSGYTYKFLLFANIPTGANHLTRNEGPYWEAGAYQMYLNVGFMFTLFFDKTKKRLLRSALFALTIVTTLSTASLIPLALILLAYLFNKQKKQDPFKYLIVLIVIIGVIFAYYSGFLNRTIEVLSGGTSSSSFAYRFSSLYSDMNSFFHSPILWGTSPDILDANRNAIGASYGISGRVGITNTFAGWFALFGISLPVFMIINYFRFSCRLGTSVLSTFLIFASVITMTSNENFTSSPLIFVIPLLLLQKEKTFYKN